MHHAYYAYHTSWLGEVTYRQAGRSRLMRSIPLALLAAGSLATLALAPEARAADRSNCNKDLERSYSKHYRQVAQRLGKRAPGRNIRKYGIRFKGTTFDAMCSEIRRSNRQLEKLLVSPPFSHSRAVPPQQPPGGVMSDQTVANGGSSNPMVNPVCESGGNPQVVSPDGQYYGKYQFDYQTWVGHGGSPASYGSASEWEQDRIASRVTYDAWPNC